MRLNCDHKELCGTLHFDYPLDKLNSWRVGGAAECYYAPSDRDDLSRFLCACPEDVPVFVLGLGSNVLIRDGGLRGAVLNLRPAFDFVRFDFVNDDSARVHAGGGTACAKVARQSVRHGMSGLQFMAGIPGTVGGALAMNAGAYGTETWERVFQVEVMRRDGCGRKRMRDEYHAAYRELKIADQLVADAGEWFLSAWFDLEPGGDPDELKSQVSTFLRRRNREQPVGLANCGSVFRNPENDYAGRLIESCGLKGYAVGDVQVSERHANFIINRGKATAGDIESLINYVGERVEKETGVRLETEVRIVGESL